MTEAVAFAEVSIAGQLRTVRLRGNLRDDKFLRNFARFAVWLRHAAPENIPFSLVHVIYTRS